MDKQTFSFELVDTHAPEIVIEEALQQIEEATRGYVMGEISPYSGEIYSYTEKTGLSLSSLTFGQNEVKVDIQEKLGEQTNEKHRYEVFLKVKGLEHYKYRLMFVDYGAIAYPVTIVMNEALAVEYSGKKSYIFRVQSMNLLNDLLDKIINSTTLVTLIQSLIREAMRQEQKAALENGVKEE